jgi:hypothetical protein
MESIFLDAPLQPRPPGCPVPLTAIQAWYWRRIRERPGRLSDLRLCATSLRLRGPLDVRQLEKSIGAVVRRHEALRTRIAGTSETPKQLIDSPQPFELSVVDLSPSRPTMAEESARWIGAGFLSEEIDLGRGPLFDARLLRLSDLDHILILAADHMISDAVSHSIVTQEISKLYEAQAQDTECLLPAQTMQFPDLAVWQHRTQESWLRDHAPYWRDRLSGIPRITLPLDHRTAHGATVPQTATHHVPFGKSLTAALREVARSEQTLMPLVFLAAYLLVMSEWCQRRDLLVESLSHGRHGHPDLRGMVGCLAHSMHLRIEIRVGESTRDLLHRITAEFQAAFQHDASRVVGNLLTEVPTEVYFNWLPAHWIASRTDHARDLGGSLKVQAFPLGREWPVTFAPHFYDTSSGVVATIVYRRDLLESRTVERFGQQLRLVAAQLTQGVKMPVALLASLA